MLLILFLTSCSIDLQQLNTTAIEYLSNYAGTLKSLVWVDVGCDSIDLFVSGTLYYLVYQLLTF